MSTKSTQALGMVIASLSNMDLGDEESMIETITVQMKKVFREHKHDPLDVVMQCVVIGLEMLDIIDDLEAEQKKKLIIAAVLKGMEETESPLDKYEVILRPLIATAIDNLLVANDGKLHIRKPKRCRIFCCGGKKKSKQSPAPAPAPAPAAPPSPDDEPDRLVTVDLNEPEEEHKDGIAI